MEWLDKDTFDAEFGPDWQFWLASPRWTFEEAAALSVGVEPLKARWLESTSDNRPRSDILDRLDVAKLYWQRCALIEKWADEHVDSGGFRVGSTRPAAVAPKSAAELFLRLNLEVPPEFAALAGVNESRRQGKWPWGDYTNSLLDAMAIAAERHWTKYNPETGKGAPKSGVVERTLQELGVAKTPASHIAAILRDKNLKPGPRDRE